MVVLPTSPGPVVQKQNSDSLMLHPELLATTPLRVTLAS